MGTFDWICAAITGASVVVAITAYSIGYSAGCEFVKSLFIKEIARLNATSNPSSEGGRTK